jgi:hypothetical protein
MYHELKESGSSSDFPYLLGNTMYKKLLARFNGFPSPWKQYCSIGDLSDFKTHDRVIMSGAPDMAEVAADGNYKELKFTDARYQIQAKTFGGTFTVDRKTIINDDLKGMLAIPSLMGSSMVRTMVKRIIGLLKGGANAYDGSVLFDLRTTATRNYLPNVALANTAAGQAAVIACMTRMRGQTEPASGELMGITQKYLLTGTTLAPIAQQLIRSAQVLPVSTNGGGTYNPIGTLIPIEEPLIDTEVSTTFWAVLADPMDCPWVEVGFLNGKETPDLLMKKAEMVSVAGGGEDPYGYEFDDIHYKIRHDFGIQLAYYQGICRGYS